MDTILLLQLLSLHNVHVRKYRYRFYFYIRIQRGLTFPNIVERMSKNKYCCCCGGALGCAPAPTLTFLLLASADLAEKWQIIRGRGYVYIFLIVLPTVCVSIILEQ